MRVMILTAICTALCAGCGAVPPSVVTVENAALTATQEACVIIDDVSAFLPQGSQPVAQKWEADCQIAVQYEPVLIQIANGLISLQAQKAAKGK